MKKCINNIATLHCNQKSESIQVSFIQAGKIQDYEFTMALASAMALSYKLNKIILFKYDFSDVNTSLFLHIVKKGISLEEVKERQIIIQTKKQAFYKFNHLLNNEHLLGPREQKDSNIKISVYLDNEKQFELNRFEKEVSF